MRTAWLAAAIGLAALELLLPRAAAAACPEHLQFLKSKCETWQSYVLPKTIPPAHGNAVADSDAAAALGMKIFYDNRFSSGRSGVACASCHDPEHAFAELKRTSHTIKEVARNAPDLINAAWYTQSHFWDGKVDNIWSAPLFTFEQADEMGSSRLHVVHTLSAIYKMRYEGLYGPMPDFSDTQRFPPEGKPGTPQFDGMAEADKKLVNQVYVNTGKALEAYIRKLAAGRSRFDDFMTGTPNALTPDARKGIAAFIRNRCDSCHNGPAFTDEGFHSLGYPAKPGRPQDLARQGGLVFARQWEFSSRSPFADVTPGATAATPAPGLSPTAVKVANVTADPTGFRTPTLRNVELTAPYGHDGAFDTLEDVIDAHARVLPGHKPPGAQDKHDIVAFLLSLSGRPPSPPWNYWPGG
jgi:cytochrome c peroxidase